MKFNFANVEVQDNSPVPDGTYKVTITDGELRTAKSGTEGINWEFTIDEGPQKGRKVWDNSWFTEKSLGRLKGFLAATGAYTDEQLDSEDFELEIDEVIGSKLQLRTKQTTAESGKTYANVAWYKPLEDSEGSDSLLP